LPHEDELRAKNQLDPAHQCAQTLGGSASPERARITEERILGYDTYKAVVDNVRVRFTIWRARDLGCAVLKGTTEFKNKSGTVEFWTDTIADVIQPGEPPAGLFELPLKFKNVAPSNRNGNTLQDDDFAKYKTSLP
jgi:hypothetical protein